MSVAYKAGGEEKGKILKEGKGNILPFFPANFLGEGRHKGWGMSDGAQKRNKGKMGDGLYCWGVGKIQNISFTYSETIE